MRFAIHGREVWLPNFVGKTPAEARKIAEQNAIQLSVERQYYSATVPEGRILSQVPPPGTRVRRGWEVRTAESLGPQRVEIPNVVGESRRAAEINIRRRGLDVGAIATVAISNSPPGQVVSQSPPPAASGVSAPKISLLVTEPSPPPPAFVMPNFVGQPLGSVMRTLGDAGMHVGQVTQAAQNASEPSDAVVVPPPTQPSPASIVASQNPAAGQKVGAGTAVNFEVK